MNKMSRSEYNTTGAKRLDTDFYVDMQWWRTYNVKPLQKNIVS